MDSKVVSKYIRNIVWASLKPLGFTHIKGRTAWRVWEHGIDVVNFQSFNSYRAGILGCTTFSFAVNLGIKLQYIPLQFGDRYSQNVDGLLLPPEEACDFRLTSSVEEPKTRNTTVVYVEESGSNPEQAVEDAREQVHREALPWFDRFRDPAEVLRTLLEDDEKLFGGTFGFGRNPSPIRSYMIGYVAKHLGDVGLAEEHLRRVLASGAMEYVYERLRIDLEAIHDA